MWLRNLQKSWPVPPIYIRVRFSTSLISTHTHTHRHFDCITLRTLLTPLALALLEQYTGVRVTSKIMFNYGTDSTCFKHLSSLIVLMELLLILLTLHIEIRFTYFNLSSLIDLPPSLPACLPACLSIYLSVQSCQGGAYHPCNLDEIFCDLTPSLQTSTSAFTRKSLPKLKYTAHKFHIDELNMIFSNFSCTRGHRYYWCFHLTSIEALLTWLDH